MQVDPKSWPLLSRLLDEWLDLPADQRPSWLEGVQHEHADILPALRELLSQPNPVFLESLPQIGDDVGGADSGHSPLGAGALAGWEWCGSPNARMVPLSARLRSNSRICTCIAKRWRTASRGSGISWRDLR